MSRNRVRILALGLLNLAIAVTIVLWGSLILTTIRAAQRFDTTVAEVLGFKSPEFGENFGWALENLAAVVFLVSHE